MKKLFAMLLVCVMVVAMFAGCAKTPKSAGTIKVGAIGPLTGDYAQYGKAVENALSIAIEEINAKGGVQFALLSEDDQGDPTMAVNAYNVEMEAGMKVLLGTVTSGACAAVAAVANEERVFVLTPSASSPTVNEGVDNVYQVCFTDPNQGAAAAITIKSLGLASKIAIIYNNAQDYSTGIYQSFVAEAKKQGLEIVDESTFSDDSNADFSVQLQSAEAAGAEMVFLPIYYTPVAAIMQQANAAGYNFKFFGVDGMDGLLAIQGFDTSLAEGSYMLTPFDANKSDDLTKSFVTKYREKFGDTPNQFAADAYDAMYIFYAACQDLGFTAETSAKEICEKIIPWMQGYTYTGLTGENMVWTADGCVSKGASAYVIENGQYASVG